MKINDLKLAAYLDEAGEEPEASCKTLSEFNIHYTVLRHCWTGNICDLSDAGHQKLTTITNDHDITVVCVASELGNIDAHLLSNISDTQVDKVFNICAYYKASYIRIYIGNKSSEDSDGIINDWLKRISEKSIEFGVTPLVEITPQSHIYKPSDVAKLLADHSRWQLLYDPVQFILRQNQDPFVRYWTLLKGRTGAIDIRDLKIGRGFKPSGFGDSRIDLTIKDALQSSYKGWFFFEPSLGRRHAEAVTKRDTFQHAIDGLTMIIQ